MTDVVAHPDLEEGSCSNPECLIRENGVCVAKGDVNECEFFEPVSLDEDEDQAPEPSTIAVPAGEALLPEHLARVLADTTATTVVPLGLVKAGKTTLMCLVFDQIRTGRLDPWSFVRSKTIVGFARRSHDSSLRSDRAAGTTRRTSLLESGMSLHLGCRDGAGVDHNFLLVDLSGEHVTQLADGKVAAVVAAALKRADHVPVVVNGRHIADPDRRAGAVYSARSLLGMVERQVMPEHARVSVVITKGDLLVGVDVNAVFDEITRSTIAAGCPQIITADRDSVVVEGEAPVVERGLGVLEFLAHIAIRTEPERGSWPSAQAPPTSALLARMWRTA